MIVNNRFIFELLSFWSASAADLLHRNTVLQGHRFRVPAKTSWQRLNLLKKIYCTKQIFRWDFFICQISFMFMAQDDNLISTCRAFECQLKSDHFPTVTISCVPMWTWRLTTGRLMEEVQQLPSLLLWRWGLRARPSKRWRHLHLCTSTSGMEGGKGTDGWRE